MRRVSFIFTFVFCFAYLNAFDLSTFSGEVGLGYMNHSMITVYRNSISDGLEESLKKALDIGHLILDSQKTVDVYNAFAIGAKLKLDYLYTSFIIGFPNLQIPTGADPLGGKLKEHGASNNIGGSVIMDWQLGGAIILMKNTPLNVFVGGGFAINYVRTKRELPKSYVDTIKESKHPYNPLFKRLSEIRGVAMAGLGLNIALNYFFTNNIGVSLDINESIYFVPLSNKRYYRGILKKNNQSFTYSITTKKDDTDIKSLIKHAWSNNLSVRLGFTIKM